MVCFSKCADCEEGTGPVDPVDPVNGADFCGPGTVWDPIQALCVGVDSATCTEDLDGDGLVGVTDVLTLLSAFGSICP